MDKLLKRVLLACMLLFALPGQAIADSLSDAKRAYDAGNYAEAVKLFMPLAQQGDALAQNSIGWMCAKGEGVPQDLKEAMRWYRLAAEQGDANAQFSLGVMGSSRFNGQKTGMSHA